jgi:plastocyanin
MKAALLAFMLVLAPSVARADDAMIMIKNFDFTPMDVTVAPGTAVVWKNLDGEPHTIVSADGSFRSPALDQDDTFRMTFSKPGAYRYICSIHPKMRATITVK